jgi:hypothetical protein
MATASMFWPLNATVPTERRDCLAAHNNKLVQTPHRFIFVGLVSYLRVEQHGIHNLSMKLLFIVIVLYMCMYGKHTTDNPY